MNAPIETIAVNDTTRILVYIDEDAEDPRTWGDHVTDDDPAVIAWRHGDVYGVAVERLIEYVRVDTGATMSQWEETDSLWGCYLDDTYTARAVAAEYFDMPE